MSNKWLKAVLGIAAAGVAAGGIACIMKKKKADEFDDDFTDGEEEDDDYDLDALSSRGYVSLTPNPQAETENETEKAESN